MLCQEVWQQRRGSSEDAYQSIGNALGPSYASDNLRADNAFGALSDQVPEGEFVVAESQRATTGETVSDIVRSSAKRAMLHGTNTVSRATNSVSG